jgi:hypothetical protein
MPRSFSNAARLPARAAWVMSLAGGCGFQSLGCSETTTNPIHTSHLAPAKARENPQARPPRGTAEAILQPGSVSEVEPFLGGSDITQIGSPATAREVELTTAPPREVETAQRKELSERGAD